MSRGMTHLRATLLLLAVSALFGLSVRAAGSAPGPQTVRLIWVQTSSHPSGKKRSWTSTLRNEVGQFGKPAGTKIGAEVGFSEGAQFVGGIKLPGGVVTYSGKVKHLARGGITVPVVDGSGNFAGVTGTYTRTAGDSAHPKSTMVVLRLQYGSFGEQDSSSPGAGHHHHR
jgi:hypothetical protein